MLIIQLNHTIRRVLFILPQQNLYIFQFYDKICKFLHFLCLLIIYVIMLIDIFLLIPLNEPSLVFLWLSFII